MLLIYKNIKTTQYKNLNDRLCTANKYILMWNLSALIFPVKKEIKSINGSDDKGYM